MSPRGIWGTRDFRALIIYNRSSSGRDDSRPNPGTVFRSGIRARGISARPSVRSRAAEKIDRESRQGGENRASMMARLLGFEAGNNAGI